METKKAALLSVSDKTGITEIAKYLADNSYTLLATGKTAQLLREKGLEITEVADYTGSAEFLGGRVKTLHPSVFGGILYKRADENDRKQIAERSIYSIDVMCVNLYPFQNVAEKADATEEDLIENIDIGGVSLLRAAAKNHKDVVILSDPSDYPAFMEKDKEGTADLKFRRELAVKAFNTTAQYDSLIAERLSREFNLGNNYLNLNLKKESDLRYGENPHQKAALYGDFYKYFEKIIGKELSYNNILDIVAATEITAEFDKPAAVIIKHNNPSGAALGADISLAYDKALKCDPVSAFGGIVCFNRSITAELAHKLNDIFLEVVIAPGFDEGVIEILSSKKQRRVLRQARNYEGAFTLRSIPGGVLVQDKDSGAPDPDNLRNATGIDYDTLTHKDLMFAWKIVKHVKSNAIVLVKDNATIGIGAGQVSRIDSVKIAINKARGFGFDVAGACSASDAFFPFPDNIEELAAAGVTAVIQPGGSVNDEAVIRRAKELGISMVFTGIRHFKH
ncbi:MAG: bifunctional phosphoribosylaminoimidazolecarboxamide formyltransferase/IMP cyclohydrolase [Ignavibacteriaceae bacterium]|nr:bifunctional phosphoribosylaminoimidazolecarboxamide formyltransferase/IMP cyclohydrolase [Ignavibacteriaceae bacterium]